MKVSLKWLNKYVDLRDVTSEQIAETLPMLGLEVESIEELGMKKISNVVVGEILSRIQHPDADKLGVCMVKVDPNGEAIQIVCGANNYKVGDRVPVALEGAELPTEDGKIFRIKKSKLRGVESNGMMCSARELGMGKDHSGLLILAERPEIGTSINDVFTDTDTVFEIELTANRGDCLSHIGIARELAAKFGKVLKLPELKTEDNFEGSTRSDLLKGVELETENCPMYTASCIRGVKIGASPEWLKRDLESIGLRSINNVVDITNFVMMEYGQPLHAFSAKKIKGSKIIVRQAKEGEKIQTLDEKQYTLNSMNMLICDGENSVALAGVMGGLNSEVDEGTTELVVESAYFNGGNVRATSRKLNIHTDSSYRFARDVDPASVKYAQRRAVDLICELAGGKLDGNLLVVGEAPRSDRTIEVTLEYIIDRLGFEVLLDEVKDVFERLGFSVIVKNGNMMVTVPSFRSEVDRPIDLVEEFIRIYGSEKIPDKSVQSKGLLREDDATYTYGKKVADYLSSVGLNECQHYTLRDNKKMVKLYDYAESLKLDNPLTSEQDSLRASLIDGLLDGIRLNFSSRNSFKGLFETGRVFRVEKGKIVELISTAFVLPIDCGEKVWRARENIDFYTIKTLAMDVVSILGVDISKLQIHNLEDRVWEKGYSASAGFIGREGFELRFGAISMEILKEAGINKIVYGAELVFKSEVTLRKKGVVKFKSFSVFPVSERDLAIIVPESLSSSDLLFDISKFAVKVLNKSFALESLDIFDVYQGKGVPEGMKSLAVRLKFRAEDRTLNADEIGSVFDKICQEFGKKYQVRAS